MGSVLDMDAVVYSQPLHKPEYFDLFESVIIDQMIKLSYNKSNRDLGCDLSAHVSRIDSAKFYSVLVMLAFWTVSKPLKILQTKKSHVQQSLEKIPEGWQVLLKSWRKIEETLAIIAETGPIDQLVGISNEETLTKSLPIV